MGLHPRLETDDPKDRNKEVIIKLYVILKLNILFFDRTHVLLTIPQRGKHQHRQKEATRSAGSNQFRHERANHSAGSTNFAKSE